MSGFGPRRPPGLRLARAGGPWWRVDDEHPRRWSWTGFETPRSRFDPASGRFRVRYAANRAAAAARERFPSQTIAEGDGDRWLVALRGEAPVLHLTRQENLDALGLDDRISTGRLDEPSPGDDLLTVGQELSDAVYDWWSGAPQPILYRTRSLPSARILAFTEGVEFEVVTARPLPEATMLLATLVTRHGFVVPERWLR